MTALFQFLFELFARVKAESPDFFKKLQWIFGILSAFSGAIKELIDQGLWSPNHATIISVIAGYIVTGSLAIFGTSFTAVKDNSTSQTKTNP